MIITLKIPKKTMLVNIVTYFIAIFPILNVYKIIIPIGDIIFSLLIMSVLICKSSDFNNVVFCSRLYFRFIFYSILVLPIAILTQQNINYTDIVSKTLHLVLYGLGALLFVKKYIEIPRLKRILIKLGFINASIAIIEQLLYRISGTQLYLLLPGVKLNYTIDNYSLYVKAFKTAASSQGYRSSALFLEPAHLSAYLLIVLILILSNGKKRSKDIAIIIIIIGAILCSYSTGGIICLMFCIVFYMIMHRGESSDKIFKIILFFSAIFAGYYFFTVESQIITIIIGRINEIGSTVYDTSGNRRILRGYFVWEKIPLFNKIVGSGIGCLEQMIIDLKIRVLTDTTYSEEMSAFFYLLCSFGLIGTFMYYRSIIEGIIKGDYFQKQLGILFVISTIYDNSIFHAISVIYLVLLFVSESETSFYYRFTKDGLSINS